MGKFWNSVVKGAAVGAHVAVGSLVFGLTTGLANVHPNPTTALGFVWYAGGTVVATSVLAAGRRWARYDPSKVD